jgi:hypothetical protein
MMNHAPAEMMPILKAILEQQRNQPGQAAAYESAALYTILQHHPSLDIAINDHTVRSRRIASALRPDKLNEVSQHWKVILDSMLEQLVPLTAVPNQ